MTKPIRKIAKMSCSIKVSVMWKLSAMDVSAGAIMEDVMGDMNVMSETRLVQAHLRP